MSLTGENISSKNDNSSFRITGEGILSSQTKSCNFSSEGVYYVTSKSETQFNCTSGDTRIINENGKILIKGESTNSNAIYLQASNTLGGIKIESGTSGIDMDSTGTIDIFSQGSNINIGVAPDGTTSENMTQSINIESLSNINIETEDVSIIATDELNLISLTGNIQIGSSTDNPVIKFEDGNLLVNQSTSVLDRQVDIAVKDESSSKTGYNGLVVNSSNVNVAADISMQTSDNLSKLGMGVYQSQSNEAVYQEYVAYQTSNVIVPLSGPEFVNSDIGKTIYWSSTGRRDTIENLSSSIIGNSDTSNITVSGSYTGSTSKNYLIQIDSNVGTNTFRWSSDGGKNFDEEFVFITYETSNVVSLNNGLNVTFSSNTGFDLNQQMSFIAKITANVSSTSSISTPEMLYSLQPYHSYLQTETETDLVISTNNTEKMRITGDGSVSFKQPLPDAEFHINSNYNRSLLVNESVNGYQINPSISHLKSGGYVIVWESQGTDGSSYGVYGQRYLSDGSKYEHNFKVNVNTTNNQSFPDVACHNQTDSNNYMVVWADSSSSNQYDIYAQIYKNNSPLQAYDIIINTSTNYDQLYPRVAGLANGNYIIVWASDVANDGNMDIYGQIVDNNGNMVGSNFIVNTTTARSQNFPFVAALSKDDPTAPNGFVVAFMTELSTDDNKFTINFRVFNSSGTGINSDVAVTTTSDANVSSISDGLISASGLKDGGFLLSFYRNYEADTSLYNNSDNLIGNTSSASGVISSKDNTNNTISLNAVSGRFLEGEEITITSSILGVGTIVEKILSVTFPSSTTAVITLDTGHKQISGYRFNSNATSSSDVIWTKRINTKLMYEDLDRAKLSNTPQTRDNSIFTFRRPLTSVASSLDNENAIYTWTNGSISNIYYQLVSITDGSFIGIETQLGLENRGLKQRNVMSSNLLSIQGNDYGYVVVWDNTGSELNDTGVYHQLIGYNHNYLKLEDGYNNITLNHDGQFGIGTSSPTSTLHIKPTQPKNYNDYNETCTLTLQNTSTNILTNDEQQKIVFQDGNGTALGQIKASHSISYDDFNPAADNLVGYYKFDHNEGSRVLDSSSVSNISATVESIGVLKNFNLEQCWQPGLINNCLLFDGIDNYVFIHDDADNNLNTILSSSSATFSLWVKVSTHIDTNSQTTYDIMSNIDQAASVASFSGLYSINLIDTSTDGNMKLKTEVRSSSATGSVTGSVTVNNNAWNLITVIVTRDSTGTTNSIHQYINGTLDGTTTFSGLINAGSGGGLQLNEQTVYIGSRNTTGNFYRGRMDELRIYNTALTTSQISKIYNFGNKTRGSVIINAKDDNNDLNLSKSFVLDYDGLVSNLKCKPGPFSLITGTITAYNSNAYVEGTNTLFSRELNIGDTIRINDADFPIVQINSDSNLAINQIPFTSPSSYTEQSIMKKSSIFSAVTADNTLKTFIDHKGNLMIGQSKLDTNFGISGSGESDDLPYITLINTTQEDTNGGRESKLVFKGNNSGTYDELVRLESSHFGVNSDKRGQFKIITNNGTDMNNIGFNIVSNGSVGMGNVNIPITNLHLRNENGPYQLLLQSQSSPLDYTNVFSEKSEIYFGGENSMNDDNSSLTANCLVSIQASGDSSTKNFDGRLDILTNNQDRDQGLEKRVSINSQGNVGVSIYQPDNLLHVAPEIRKTNFDKSTISSISTQTITFDSSLLSAEEQLKLVGGTVVIDNDNLTSHKITAVPAGNQVTVTGSISGNGSKNVHIHYPGLNVSSSGFIGIGETNPQSTMHVTGSVTKSITTISSTPTTLDVTHYTVLVDSTSGIITINLPANSLLLKGRIYIIKRIGSNNVVIETADSANIDGSSNYTISTIYHFIKVQSDGTNWYIIGSGL